MERRRGGQPVEAPRQVRAGYPPVGTSSVRGTAEAALKTTAIVLDVAKLPENQNLRPHEQREEKEERRNAAYKRKAQEGNFLIALH